MSLLSNRCARLTAQIVGAHVPDLGLEFPVRAGKQVPSRGRPVSHIGVFQIAVKRVMLGCYGNDRRRTHNFCYHRCPAPTGKSAGARTDRSRCYGPPNAKLGGCFVALLSNRCERLTAQIVGANVPSLHVEFPVRPQKHVPSRGRPVSRKQV